MLTNSTKDDIFKMICRQVTSDPPEDAIGSSIQVSGKSFVDTAALSDILQVL